MEAALAAFPNLAGRRLIHETVRRMIDTLVTDLIDSGAARIAEASPADIGAVRAAPELIGFSDAVREEQLELKRFLNRNLYRHFRVARMSSKARRIVSDLFAAFIEEPDLLPPEFQARAADDKPRAIADYIAGMTDRYAMLEHRRLFAVDGA
jgi:dGTPase